MSTGDAPKHLEPVAGDLACQGCGYNLRGLLRSGRCPECGADVERSWPTHTIAAAAAIARNLKLIGLGVFVFVFATFTVVLYPFVALVSRVMILLGETELRAVTETPNREPAERAASSGTWAIILGVPCWMVGVLLMLFAPGWGEVVVLFAEFLALRNCSDLIRFCRSLAASDGDVELATQFESTRNAVVVSGGAVMVMGLCMALFIGVNKASLWPNLGQGLAIFFVGLVFGIALLATLIRAAILIFRLRRRLLRMSPAR